MTNSTLEKNIEEILSKSKLTLDEYKLIKDLIGREPNEVEIAMFGVMWSEHCAYKNSKPLLQTLPTKSERVKVLAGPGENAGIVDVGDGIRIAFKIESHNRPTAIEPFQGATTGVGGILRDILTLGAKPIAFLNSLHFGDLSNEHSRYLITHAVAGIANYGNCTGIPTVGGQAIYHESYQGNPLVNAMCIGLLEVEQPVTAAAKGVGNPVIYVGSETGRDGLGGASFASSGLSNKSNKDRPAVQIGDPFMGKILIESCLEAYKSGLVIASQDMGAAGLTCACSEMSAKGNVGIDLNLDKVPSRGELEPHEYLLSESQERMLFIAELGKEDELISIFKRWNLPAMVVGEVTNSELVRVFYKNELVAELPPKALTDQAPIYTRESLAPKVSINVVSKADFKLDKEEIQKELLDRLSSSDFSSREWIYEQYDQQVQLNTISKPGQADAAVLRLRKPNGKPSEKALAVSLDCNPKYVQADPYLGAQIAMAEAARNLSSVGAKPLAITNNLNFGNPERPESFWYLEQSVKGIRKACEELDVPVTGGNVSLYNEFSDGRHILPTPVIGMIGLVEDYKQTCKIPFKEEGNNIWLIGDTFNERDCPSLDWSKEKLLHQFLQEKISSGEILSCHDLSEGGLLISLSEIILASDFGVQIEIEKHKSLRLASILFGESQSRAIVTTKPGNVLNAQGLKTQKLGIVSKKQNLQINLKEFGEILDLSKDELKRANRVEV
ncbi:MAG: phosphoribosylformylglycinamidine synthase subunit PurL [Candidatus Caenarcaniphilales bacterium]|nr:phosphoribosylformylglycinamidine synthase subunit PurL [Candidatus Caenarcaniphilales bacterium]